MDKRNNGTDPVLLYVYKRVDTFDGNGNDTATVTLKKTISLDITAGPGAHCQMAGNPSLLFMGTDLSVKSLRMDKKKYKVVDGFPGAVTYMNADSRGYITISQPSGFVLMGPDGGVLLVGGGSSYVAGTQSSTEILN
jgi:hypothetical protein